MNSRSRKVSAPPDLVLGDHRPADLAGRVLEVVVQLLVPLPRVRRSRTRTVVPASISAAVLGDLRLDPVDVEVDVDAVGDGLLVGVLGDQVLSEETEGLHVGVAVKPTMWASKYSRTARHLP